MFELLSRLDTAADKIETIASEFEIDLTTAYRAVKPLQEWNLITSSEGGIYETTGLGTVVRTHFETTIESVSSSLRMAALSYLLGASSRSMILTTLSQSPADKAMLADGPGTLSRSTIHRAISGLTEHGLIVRQQATGRYVSTERGRSVLTAYEKLIDGVAIARRHTVFFCCCDKRIADIPVLGLRNAEQVIDLETAPDRTMAVLETLVDDGITEFRGVQSHVSTRLADIFDPVIRSDAPVELLLTPRVFTELPTTGRYRENVRRGLQATNVAVRIVPDIEAFPFGLAIINNDTVTLGPAHVGMAFDTPDGRRSESLVCRDPVIVDWAEGVYREYRTQSRAPLEQLIQILLDHISRNVPLTDSGPDSEV
jgi:predicted transcriptional regulator